MHQRDDGFSTFLKARPKRIAFGIDPGEPEADSILDSILAYNIDCWGGRHNPILPISDGSLYSDYRSLAVIADPDVIYTFAGLSDETVIALDRDFAPLQIQQHRIAGRAFHVDIDNLVDVRGVLRNLNRKFPGYFGPPTLPKILAFESSVSAKISPFVRWNCGVSRCAYSAVRDGSIVGTTPSTPDDCDILRSIYSDRNVVLPINVCADAPLQAIAEHTAQKSEFLIVFGDSPWNKLHYWNLAFFRRRQSLVNAGVDAMWMPTSVPDDATLFPEVLQFISRKVFSGDHGQRHILVVSYDQTAASCEALARRLCKETRNNFFPATAQALTPGAFPLCAPERRTDWFFQRKGPVHQYAPGKTVFLNAPEADDIPQDSDARYMLDVRIDNPWQEPEASNIDPWFMLPARRGLSRAFGLMSSRITPTHELSAEVTAEVKSLRVDIPDAMQIFQRLLIPMRDVHWTNDLRNKLPTAEHLAVETGEKGQYFDGVLNLFGSTSRLFSFFGHPFWRSVVERLAIPPQSTRLRDKVAADVKKLAPYLKDPEDAASAREWLVEEVFTIGSQIPRESDLLKFSDMETMHRGYLRSLPDEEKRWAVQGCLQTEGFTDEQVLHAICRASEGASTVEPECEKMKPEFQEQIARGIRAALTEKLSWLTSREVLLQGTELSCPRETLNKVSPFHRNIE